MMPLGAMLKAKQARDEAVNQRVNNTVPQHISHPLHNQAVRQPFVNPLLMMQQHQQKKKENNNSNNNNNNTNNTNNTNNHYELSPLHRQPRQQSYIMLGNLTAKRTIDQLLPASSLQFTEQQTQQLPPQHQPYVTPTSSLLSNHHHRQQQKLVSNQQQHNNPPSHRSALILSKLPSKMFSLQRDNNIAGLQQHNTNSFGQIKSYSKHAGVSSFNRHNVNVDNNNIADDNESIIAQVQMLTTLQQRYTELNVQMQSTLDEMNVIQQQQSQLLLEVNTKLNAQRANNNNNNNNTIDDKLKIDQTLVVHNKDNNNNNNQIHDEAQVNHLDYYNNSIQQSNQHGDVDQQQQEQQQQEQQQQHINPYHFLHFTTDFESTYKQQHLVHHANDSMTMMLEQEEQQCQDVVDNDDSTNDNNNNVDTSNYQKTQTSTIAPSQQSTIINNINNINNNTNTQSYVGLEQEQERNQKQQNQEQQNQHQNQQDILLTRLTTQLDLLQHKKAQLENKIKHCCDEYTNKTQKDTYQLKLQKIHNLMYQTATYITQLLTQQADDLIVDDLDNDDN